MTKKFKPFSFNSWWEQYNKLPWPDYVATLLQAGVFHKMEGDEDGRQNERIRRTVVRYLILAYVLCLRRISSRVRNQFPDMDSLLASWLIRKDEVRNPLTELQFKAEVICL